MTFPPFVADLFRIHCDTAVAWHSPLRASPDERNDDDDDDSDLMWWISQLCFAKLHVPAASVPPPSSSSSSSSSSPLPAAADADVDDGGLTAAYQRMLRQAATRIRASHAQYAPIRSLSRAILIAILLLLTIPMFFLFNPLSESFFQIACSSITHSIIGFLIPDAIGIPVFQVDRHAANGHLSAHLRRLAFEQLCSVCGAALISSI
jgi:hypothetical protein